MFSGRTDTPRLGPPELPGAFPFSISHQVVPPQVKAVQLTDIVDAPSNRIVEYPRGFVKRADPDAV